MALMEMRNVNYLENGQPIISDLSLSIEKGSISAFVGTPGSGKSTSLKLLAGLIIPNSGELYFEGMNVYDMNRKQNKYFRKKAAFMFQDSALWANQDLFNNLDLPLRTHFPYMNYNQRKKVIEEVVQKVEFKKPLTLRPAALSIGEQKKIGFARALICEPEVLFLDEPTESLDEKTSELFISILKEFCYNGNTMVFVSHDTYLIDSFRCDRFYYDEGRLVNKYEV